MYGLIINYHEFKNELLRINRIDSNNNLVFGDLVF